ncbi:MAG: site-specific integrase [Eubacterium sp.]|nr:site-specific integrase [Eubacterium sp.]
MSKKGTNIYKRKDGRWEARYIKSVESDGSKKYGSVYGHSYREARDKQLYFMHNLHLSVQQTHITLTELTREWLSSIVFSVKKSTYQKYESLIRNHIEQVPIGQMQVRFITSKTINDFAVKRLDKLSVKTVNDILVIMSLALSYAEEIYNIIKPKIRYLKTPTKETRVLSISEQQQLETYLLQDMDICKFGVLLALYTGIRVGELCALQWSDMKATEIVISKTLHRIKDRTGTILETTEPKTKSSNRIIPIPTFFIPIVEQFRSYGSVLKLSNGNIVEPRLMQHKFEKYIKECGLPKTNFHALRHTFATRCVESGFDIKSLSEILGHTDVRTTLNKYVHSSYEQKQKNMELLRPASNL